MQGRAEVGGPIGEEAAATEDVMSCGSAKCAPAAAAPLEHT